MGRPRAVVRTSLRGNTSLGGLALRTLLLASEQRKKHALPANGSGSRQSSIGTQGSTGAHRAMGDMLS